MLNDDSIYFIYGQGKDGVAIGFIIGEDLVYDIPAWKTFYDLLISADDIIDISIEYPDHDGITVAIMQNNEIIESFQTTEYFGSVLLSNPLIVDMAQYSNGANVVTPSKFINNEFIQA
jgi:nicotinic acid mononucleotide adenylyltransferase